MSSLSPYTNEYWSVVKERNIWKAEALAARVLLHPEDGLMNRPHVTLAMRQAYASARAACEAAERGETP